MNPKPVRIGTRRSALAMAQARLVAEALDRDGRAHKLVPIETDADRSARDTAEGEGAFVTAIERALHERHVDLAVHNAKDVPTDEDARLRIVAYLARADPRDCLVVNATIEDGLVADLDDRDEQDRFQTLLDRLPAGACIGTDSPRRAGFILARRPDLVVRPLHGNVDARLRRLDAGEADAIVLAVSGLTALGREDRIAAILEPEIVPPAAGQGAIAIQSRADDATMLAIGATVDHTATRIQVEAERSFLRAATGSCDAAVGALARSRDGLVSLLGGFAEADGSASCIDAIEGKATEVSALAVTLAGRLVEQRARGIGRDQAR
jgi:hydroxymethylbilane synthase